MPTVEEILIHLPEVGRALIGLRYQLLGLLAKTDSERPTELSAELRAAIECALHDHLAPLIEMLAVAARNRDRR